MTAAQRIFFLIAFALGLTACENPFDLRGEFLEGTDSNRQIGIVLDSAGRSLLLFQLGDPERTHRIELAAFTPAAPIDFAVRGYDAAIALGEAGAVALIDLAFDATDRKPNRVAAFPGGGRVVSVSFVTRTRPKPEDLDTLLAVDAATGTVAQIAVGNGGNTTLRTVRVATGPRKMLVALDRAYVLSGDGSAEGVVTVLNARTLEVLATIPTGASNPRDMAFGSADRLYVIHAGSGNVQGSLSEISPLRAELRETVRGMGPDASRVYVDTRSRAYISSRWYGTIVWHTGRREFLHRRGPSNAVCAAPCRGATDAWSNEDGDIYQITPGGSEPSRVRVWEHEEGLDDDQGYRVPGTAPGSIPAGVYATQIQIHRFDR